ncbi:peptidyl-prolyl cis-trans isomerase [Rubrimonas cliftonensis]|uniref:peptidylprolyl isomerase n=1 Tax=Rubrimonas cliftonensis TaxID=89524 RepID=A0A1H3WRP3_9RHOB|nr:peptidylprolyl isomerase [Rubrimonas cliftonensis]SDZ89052.1 PPIC-type PPIASE domain-containing protein [Rubrimonas cliftonensis]
MTPQITRTGGLARRILRDPLAQFLAIGLALFAADRLTRAEAADPRLIVVDAPAYGEIVDIFAETRGRAPTPAEMEPLVDRWIMNETLYREARALGLDEGDEMVRERIMQKLRVLMHTAVTVDDPDERTLRAWYEANRDRYTAPELITFRLARLDGDEEQAKALAARLNDAFAGKTQLAPGEVRIFPFPERPRPALEQVFGTAFVETLTQLPAGEWAPAPTEGGWQVAMFEERVPPVVTEFEDVAGSVEADWRDERFKIAARQSIEALMASYRVTRAPYDADAFAERAAEVAASDADSFTQ